MKEYAEKYPLAWEDLEGEMRKSHDLVWSNEPGVWLGMGGNRAWLPFGFLFGYLVLEYFPRHGINFEIDTFLDIYQGIIFDNDGFPHWINCSSIKSLIAKAFEVRQGQLEGKK